METQIPIFMAAPFILMLACIAVLPLFAEHFWESNKNKLIVALVLGIPTSIWMLANGLGEHVYDSVLFDYIPFIILLGGLYVITGGIFIDADFEASPRNNTIILIIGAVLASFMGTTGAAMLLIRLLLHTNKQRKHKVHTVLFFIGIVANCGGLLTPLGDPPLFMMYLRGADFFWFFNFWQPWLFVNAVLLICYNIMDRYWYKREDKEEKAADKTELQPLKVTGTLNFVWLLLVIAAVAFINPKYLPFMNENPFFGFLRDAVIIIATALSLITTKKSVRQENNFSWSPIMEVAYLFIGIFLTMVPVLLLLKTNAGSLGIDTTTAFYYCAGALSSFLDNTPTAVTFYSLAQGLFAGNPELINGEIVAGIPSIFMEAICVAAVTFGSLTYIGNGPNFMVKSIAEQEGIKMPQFFQYMIKFSLIIILPTLILCNLIFF
ncbi:MAG: sodium:proton antiporter [Ignavibacteria bacterium]|jgi:Na+/H+ antiporter NhaD/arsenite permease-like protein|nr:sodium:proton antiporter [Ignavibacteria bacterium]